MVKDLHLFIAAVLALVGAGSIRAQEGVEVSGFGDLVYVGGGDRFELGQVEVDLAKKIDRGIDVEVALALDEGVFSTGSFIVDFDLFGSDGEHLRHVSGIDHSGLVVGQFDVPFGLDWEVFPSIDRKLISAPVAIENTHDGWGDFGVQGYVAKGGFDAVAYAVNGFGYEVDGQEVGMNLTLGGRIGFKPHERVELGGSYAAFLDGDYSLDMGLMGVDVQCGFGALSLKGEYLIHSLGLAGDEELTNSGFYFQGFYDPGRYFAVGRYGEFRPDEGADLRRISLGVGRVIAEGCEARLEQQFNAEEDDLTLLQLVVAF